MSSDGQVIALVGGGRWGRVHASNLSRMLSPRDKVVWVSRFNQDALANSIRTFTSGGPKFEIRSTLIDALDDRPVAAIVVTAPDTHFAVAKSCLEAGLHVFVEKPLSFRRNEAESLIDLASSQGRLLAVGLHLLSATYLQHLCSLLNGALMARISIRWFDPDKEQRYGEMKRTDHLVSLAHDIYPHIWSIVKALTDCEHQIIVDCQSIGAAYMSVMSQAGEVSIQSECGRNAQARERLVQIDLKNGDVVRFDFTEEPGHLARNGIALPSDPLWGKTPRPVMAEAQEFLRLASNSSVDTNWPHLAARCVDSVVGAEILQTKLG